MNEGIMKTKPIDAALKAIGKGTSSGTVSTTYSPLPITTSNSSDVHKGKIVWWTIRKKKKGGYAWMLNLETRKGTIGEYRISLGESFTQEHIEALRKCMGKGKHFELSISIPPVNWKKNPTTSDQTIDISFT
jgi:hypothetical protein